MAQLSATVAAILQLPVADAAARRHRVQAGLPPRKVSSEDLRNISGVDLVEVVLAARAGDDPLGRHLARSAVALVADGDAVVVAAVKAAAAHLAAAVHERHVGGVAGGDSTALSAVTC